MIWPIKPIEPIATDLYEDCSREVLDTIIANLGIPQDLLIGAPDSAYSRSVCWGFLNGHSSDRRRLRQ